MYLFLPFSNIYNGLFGDVDENERRIFSYSSNVTIQLIKEKTTGEFQQQTR